MSDYQEPKCLGRFLGRLSQDHAEVFEHADVVLEMIQLIAGNLDSKPILQDELNEYGEILLAFFHKTAQSYLSICTIADRGYLSDARSLLRTMIETHINLRYINQNQEHRAHMVFLYRAVSFRKKLDRMSKNPYYSEGLFSQVQSLHEKYAINIDKASKDWSDAVEMEYSYPDKRYWSGKHLERMANECGLGELYEIQYKLLCTDVHFDLDCMRQQYDEERESVGFLKDHEQVVPIILEACIHVICIAELTNSHFDLGLNDSIGQVKKQLGLAAAQVGIPPGDWFH